MAGGSIRAVGVDAEKRRKRSLGNQERGCSAEMTGGLLSNTSGSLLRQDGPLYGYIPRPIAL